MFSRFANKSRVASGAGARAPRRRVREQRRPDRVPEQLNPAPTTAAVSSAANSQFGTILTDGTGRTLYFFDNDKPIKPQSSCTGQCVKAWPIVPASDGSTVGAGLDAAKLGHIVRTDGQSQLTYNNWPLYTFSGDTAAGQTNGQGLMGIWHVAGVDGKPITMAAVQPALPSGTGY